MIGRLPSPCPSFVDLFHQNTIDAQTVFDINPGFFNKRGICDSTLLVFCFPFYLSELARRADMKLLMVDMDNELAQKLNDAETNPRSDWKGLKRMIDLYEQFLANTCSGFDIDQLRSCLAKADDDSKTPLQSQSFDWKIWLSFAVAFFIVFVVLIVVIYVYLSSKPPPPPPVETIMV